MPSPQRPDARAIARFDKSFGKAFGEGRLVTGLNEKPYDVTSTGSLAVDYITGVGGLVEGRVTEIWGQEGVGKTTMVLHAIREYQKAHPDRLAGFVDMEQKLDHGYAAEIGVNPDTFSYYLPDDAEDVANALQKMVQAEQRQGDPLFGLLVVDSIGGMVPKTMFETEAEKDARLGRNATIVTRMVQTLAVRARQRKQTILLVNQVRANVSGFGKATTTGGGWALRHVTTMKFEVKATGEPPLTIGTDLEKMQVGKTIAVHMERSNVSPPRRTAQVRIISYPTDKYGPVGVDKAQEAFDLGVLRGFIERAGAWYTTPDGVRHNGGDATVAHLRAKPSLIEDIRARLIASRADDVIPPTPAEETP